MAYEYLLLLLGLSIATHMFTKCVETALSSLQGNMHSHIVIFRQLGANSELQRGSRETDNASFVSHSGSGYRVQKSSLTPSQQFLFLGLEICSITIQARLSELLSDLLSREGPLVRKCRLHLLVVGQI